MKPARISSKPIAKALVTRRAILAQFGVPGTAPRLIRGGDGNPVEYPNEELARRAALDAFFEEYTRVFGMARFKNNYSTPAPAEFASALSEAKVSARLFAQLYGTTESRIHKWLGGEANVPHSAYAFAVMLRHGSAFSEAERLMRERISTDGHDEQEG